MISANDTTILAVLSRYPNMSSDEANQYISKIENKENVPICYAVIGRTSKEELDQESRKVFEEFQAWSQRRTRQIREEQITARKRQQETNLALKLNQLHQRGLVPDEFLALYGISGELPDRNLYMEMSPEEKQGVWEERMESRLGPNWRERFQNRGNFFGLLTRRKIEYNKINWNQEGF